MYSTITFQAGPIREVGENGDQVDDVLAVWLADRTADRAARGVEGTSAP